jgi:hypothetical protein
MVLLRLRPGLTRRPELKRLTFFPYKTYKNNSKGRPPL